MSSASKREVEEWVRRILVHELGRPVEHNDDNSRPSMYDLRVGPSHAPEMAIEVNLAADFDRMRTDSLPPPDFVSSHSLSARWIIQITPATRRKGLSKHLVQTLANIEQHADDRRLWGGLGSLPKSDKEALKKLGVVYAQPYPPEGDCGGFSIGTPGVGGDVDHAGEHFCRWIGSFLSSLDDVVKKLRLARAVEHHAFVPVAFGGAPWEVESFLAVYGPDGKPLGPPPLSPSLPSPINQVWVVSTRARSGWRWNGRTWVNFQAAGPPIDDR